MNGIRLSIAIMNSAGMVVVTTLVRSTRQKTWP